MLPLPQPELKDSSEPNEGVIETWIALRSNQRHQPPCNDVKEAGNSEDMECQK